ncbi:SulP family inorganic anion transporter [Mycolicibacterium thermoresistibile]|uniref:Sulfate transporter n=2 Tax=Mycolicibacterium thermoresistibile TaxID=1797 RepID=G7CMY4_MYCT3|nr:SulP family inorganic anion transporter [Mycolicibacterium thermoresistibile]EHI10711.1 sulfate transporter [Mycolicibacterium thermoresistibile ATCC 19527]MCV7187281.1 SulP family inorganic anion transporter [Mycolicibacterium thermoresistibile]GAT14249.1 sulfate permease [Mycolicibacterium thermoresistibile]SNW20588.1 sulfate permease-like transporter, MFS superfamily [Mycolicibacterium thermoresistibile]
MIATAKENLIRLLPSRRDYAELPRSWRRDILAGITVGVVALPLALAFGISSGVGAAAGLITAVVAGLVAAVFGGSHIQVSGPTGAMAVILAPIVAQHGLTSIALVTVLAGLIVLAAGITGLGRAVTFIPWPVIEGFTLGIAAIIFLQQVPAAFATEAPAGQRTLVAAWHVVTHADWTAAVKTLSVVSLVALLMVVLPRLHRSIPESLTAVVAATVIVTVFGISVATIGELPSQLPTPVLPQADMGAMQTLLGAALAIAALAAIESLLSARVAATMSATGPYHPDRELVGQGMASVASGLFGGMPATGAIARTAVNVRSGARTRLAAIVHSLVLLAVVYLATGPVSAIPLSALAGVLMVTSFRMVSLHTARRILRSTRSDALTFVLTALVTITFDLIEAVQIGVLVAAFFALRNVARRSGVTREELPGEPQPGDERIALLRLEGSMFFGVAERMSSTISEIEADDISVVIIRLSQLGTLDATGANSLAQIATELERRGITVIIKGVQPEHSKLLSNVGVFESLRHEKHLIDSLEDAIEHARSHVARQQTARTTS